MREYMCGYICVVECDYILNTKDENDTEISRTEPQSFSTFNPIEFVFCGQKRILNSKTKYGIHNSEFGTKSVWTFVRSISTFLHYIRFRTEFKFGLEPNLVHQGNSDPDIMDDADKL
jgi:hypothetical protein